jgi:hypothetical protein
MEQLAMLQRRSEDAFCHPCSFACFARFHCLLLLLLLLLLPLLKEWR